MYHLWYAYLVGFGGVEHSGYCDDCGASPATHSLTALGTFCDPCADRHLSEITGFPLLPAPPDPITITGPDGRQHRLRFRLRRVPTGISVDLEETLDGDGEEDLLSAGAGAPRAHWSGTSRATASGRRFPCEQ
ncbi:MAG TPA: hypothetical protein VNG13_04265 [Mycobacteriales bacterium]|nr:hypothetical protein [Mycobacteriales bacterium]